jgi:hypothetical protein
VQGYISITGTTFPVLRNGQGLQSSYGIFYDNYVVVDEDGIVRYTSVNEIFTGLGRFNDANLRAAILGGVTSTEVERPAQRFEVQTPVRAGTETTVRLATPAAGGTHVTLYDARGRSVRELPTPATSGWSTFLWRTTGTRGEPLPTGVYFVQLRVPHTAPVVRKMVVVAR